MKKRSVSLLLSLMLILGVLFSNMYEIQASSLTAIPTSSEVLVNGRAISFESYNINGNNYFKLRDLAVVLIGTEKQFEVSWNGNAINLMSNKPYKIIGGELVEGDSTIKNPIINTARIYKDGKEITLTAYNINGNNFFKLRDIAQAFDIGVTWNGVTNTIGIDTSIGYGLLEPSPINTNPNNTINHVILSVVYVTKEWMPFTDITGWTTAARIKEAQGVKYYEAAIWDDTHSIRLYAFPNDYDGFYGYHEGLPTEEKVAYRESFLVKKFDNMPTERYERGEFVLNAFTEFAKILVQKHPDASHNLLYSGHGVPVGELFENHLNHTQANKLLANWHSMLGRKLGFVDMGGPCSKGSFHNLEAFYEHADYYIASDLAVGGNFDDFSMEVLNRSDTLYNYPRLLSSYPNMKDALVERVNLARLGYEDSKNFLTENKKMQSMYLYSCSEFSKYKDKIASFMKSQDLKNSFVDIKKVMGDNGAESELLKHLDSIIIHSVDDKDMFTWLEEWNGMSWIDNYLQEP